MTTDIPYFPDEQGDELYLPDKKDIPRENVDETEDNDSTSDDFDNFPETSEETDWSFWEQN